MLHVPSNIQTAAGPLSAFELYGQRNARHRQFASLGYPTDRHWENLKKLIEEEEKEKAVEEEEVVYEKEEEKAEEEEKEKAVEEEEEEEEVVYEKEEEKTEEEEKEPAEEKKAEEGEKIKAEEEEKKAEEEEEAAERGGEIDNKCEDNTQCSHTRSFSIDLRRPRPPFHGNRPSALATSSSRRFKLTVIARRIKKRLIRRSCDRHVHRFERFVWFRQVAAGIIDNVPSSFRVASTNCRLLINLLFVEKTKQTRVLKSPTPSRISEKYTYLRLTPSPRLLDVSHRTFSQCTAMQSVFNSKENQWYLTN
ncbi:unnamed protein product [Nesidiocoris tenuis]|uniref:Uncharacterized protein n=1 Tax=Nesidiocoris tenuis TaxID=355587 RepID=A0A6H5H9J9_9HEMI|nr:unnamed protein product [Nesidiocoris tenuis]